VKVHPAASFLLFVCSLFFLIQNSVYPSALLTKTKTDISSIKSALSAFYAEHQKYPDPKTWQSVVSVYFEDKKAPKDPWGNEYVYVYPDENEHYYIYSMGPDKMSTTAGHDPDDICTCKGAGYNNEMEYISDPRLYSDPIPLIYYTPLFMLGALLLYIVLYFGLLKWIFRRNDYVLTILRKFVATAFVLSILLLIVSILFVSSIHN
jgi:hypothetical protein